MDGSWETCTFWALPGCGGRESLTRRAGGLNDAGTGRRGGGNRILSADDVGRRPPSTGSPPTVDTAEGVAQARPGADEGARASR